MPNFIILAVILSIAAISMGCQTGSNTATNTNPASNAPAANSVANAVVPKLEAPSTDVTSVGSLATPTEAYKTAYELRKKKDIAGLKKIMSKDILEFLAMVGEEEKKSLDDLLKEMVEKPQANKAEVRNEKIKGDRAELEYLTETGEWKTMDFEKVDGKWLLAFPKAEDPSGKEPKL